jgi:hypothetical protein
MREETRLFFQTFVTEEAAPPRPARRGLHVLERPPRRALRHATSRSARSSSASRSAPRLAEGCCATRAWLTVTSTADRTSPVKRGKWILEQLLCDAPPPPPPASRASPRQRSSAQTRGAARGAPHAAGVCVVPLRHGSPRLRARELRRHRRLRGLMDKGTPVDASGELRRAHVRRRQRVHHDARRRRATLECAVDEAHLHLRARARRRGTSDRTCSRTPTTRSPSVGPLAASRS